MPNSDVIQISGTPGASYTIGFRNAGGSPVTVKDPVLHLSSLGSTLNFTHGAPKRLTSENNFRVVGSQVIGDPSNTIRPSGNSDTSGRSGSPARIRASTSRRARTTPASRTASSCSSSPSRTAARRGPRPSGPRWAVASAPTGPWTGVPTWSRKVSGNAQTWTAQPAVPGRWHPVW